MLIPKAAETFKPFFRGLKKRVCLIQILVGVWSLPSRTLSFQVSAIAFLGYKNLECQQIETPRYTSHMRNFHVKDLSRGLSSVLVPFAVVSEESNSLARLECSLV